MTIRNWAWKLVWKEYKNKYTMQELADALDASLPTFFRAVNKKVGKTKKVK